MSNAVYPDLPGLTWPIAREPLWNTGVKRTPSGREFRTTAMTSPRHRRTLKYEFLRNTAALGEYQRLFDFFNARAGQFDTFLLVDRDDCNVTLQPLAVADGVTTQYQLGRWLPGTPHNLLGHSQDMSQSIWSKSSSSVLGGADIGPDGMITGSQCSVGAATSGGVFQTVTVIPGQQYTFSFWGKRHPTFGAARWRVYDNSNTADVGSGDVYSQINASTYTRIVVPFTAPAGCRSVRVYVVADGGVGGGLYVWGAQVNTGGSASPYVPSLGASASLPKLEPVFDWVPGSVSVYLADWQGLTRCYPTARTNLLLRSAELDNGAWARTALTVTANAVAAPDSSGSAADLLVESSTTALHITSQSPSLAATGHVVSIFAKAGTRSRFVLFKNNSGANMARGFDLSNGTTFANDQGYSEPVSFGMQALGNGWYRCWIQVSSTGGSSSVGVWLVNGSAGSYAGDGTSGLYTWGAQLEASTVLTRYIPTTTAAVTVTDYTVSAAGLVTFATAPLSGAQVLWSGSYYWRYRFEQDSLSLEEFMRAFWQSGQVKLISVKP